MRLLVGRTAVLSALRADVQRSGQQAVAQRAGISKGLLSNVLLGRREPRGKLLRYLGYRRVIAYERIGDDA